MIHRTKRYELEVRSWLEVSISFCLSMWGEKPGTNQNTNGKISLDYKANGSIQNKDNTKYNLSSFQ